VGGFEPTFASDAQTIWILDAIIDVVCTSPFKKGEPAHFCWWKSAKLFVCGLTVHLR
jgi:hypothetical protein